MRKGIRQKPPVDRALLRQVLRKHMIVFVPVSAAGMLFSVASLFIFSRSDGRFMLWLLGGVFLCVGLFLIGFACKSTLSSISYYYQKGQLKRHGLNLNATVVRKARAETDIQLERERHSRHEHIDELALKVWFDFQFDGQAWQCADLLSNEKVFDALSEGQSIPIRILPWMPESASIRQRALLNQLKRDDLRAQPDDTRTSKPLIEFYEI
ncbi:hypothetical protein B2M27_03125 [Kluyvera intermedia]|uniref:Uncharacterized protein n=1 Tax=Kluyvera intermedia TaxID=61648 RepID=A0ABX3UK88_KLUIN|nr:hypothetical protein [Kluyvera intermedia]ORJ51817.1 hypothetical protein B2M27_03125 [Kluyvera intermedia]